MDFNFPRKRCRISRPLRKKSSCGLRFDELLYSRINRKAGVAAPTHKILVIFDRFFTSNGTNPYTVDSYDASDYKIIPSYEGTQLRDVIDFRPIVPQQITGSGTQSSPFTLTATKYFDFASRAFTSNEDGLPGIKIGRAHV